MRQRQLFVMITLVVACCAIVFTTEATATQAGTLTHRGVDFRYVREGAGPPIVVIGSSIVYPRAFSPELREHFELIFVDARHFIPSYRPKEDELALLTLETFADDVEAIRSHLAIERWAVLGHSVQGQIALEYADRYPERTSRLILIAAIPFAGSELGELGQRFWDENASSERKRQHDLNRRAMERKIADASPGRRWVVNYIANAARWWVDPTYDSTSLWEGVETGPAFGALARAIPSRAQVRGKLERLEIPTLLILGKLDFGAPYVVWEALAKDLDRVKYVLLEEDSHNPQTESPSHFDPELIKWLER